MVSNDKVITSPITVQDAAQCLHKNTLDIGSLCCASDRINPWSKYKPISSWGLPELTEAQKSALNYGWSVPNGNPEHFSLTSGHPSWTYNCPVAGGATDYRLLDFNNYDHRTRAYRNPWKFKAISVSPDSSVLGSYTGTAPYNSLTGCYRLDTTNYIEYTYTPYQYKNIIADFRVFFNDDPTTDWTGKVSVIMKTTRNKVVKVADISFGYNDLHHPTSGTDQTYLEVKQSLSASISGPFKVCVKLVMFTGHAAGSSTNYINMDIQYYDKTLQTHTRGFKATSFEFNKNGRDGFKIIQSTAESMWTADSSALTTQILGPAPWDLIAWVRFADSPSETPQNWTVLLEQNSGILIFNDLLEMNASAIHTLKAFKDVYFGYGSNAAAHQARIQFKNHPNWYAYDMVPTSYDTYTTYGSKFYIAPYGYFTATDFWAQCR